MFKKKFFSDWAKLRHENQSCRMISLGLTAALIISSVANYNLFQEKTVVVIPPEVTKKFTVTGNTLSQEYFEQMGFYLADRVLSVSPQNVQNSFDTIMPYMTKDPTTVKLIKESLMVSAQTIQENDIYQVFYPMKVFVNEIGTKFTVEGTLKKMSGNNSISTLKASITFDFFVVNGHIKITAIEVNQ